MGFPYQFHGIDANQNHDTLAKKDFLMCLPSLFGSNSTPAPTPPPVIAAAAPIDTTQDNAQSKAARAEEARRAKLAAGLDSTVASSPLGDTSKAQTQKTNLLGYTA